MNTNMVRHNQEVTAPRTEAIYVPDVDIIEDPHQVVLYADMPGVNPKEIELQVENRQLTLAGVAQVEAPAGAQLVGQEYGVGRFRRSFALSAAMEVSGIKARMQNGVLRVTIPKREEVKTRKIEIGE